MNNKEKIENFTVFLLAGMILALTAGIFTMNKKIYSENENRYLAAFPKTGWESVRDGEYMQEMDAYLSDHFPGRDFFMGIKTRTELAMGKKKINGVYFAEDNFLIEEYKAPGNTERITETLKNFSDKLDEEIRLRLMLVPTAVWVYEEKLPKYAQTLNQMDTAEILYAQTEIPGIRCGNELLAGKKEGKLYYETDHHWTTRGAYAGYRAFCREMGWEAAPLEEMEAQIAAEDFCGTLYSKACAYNHKGEEIKVYTHPDDRLQVEYKDTGKVTDSLYNLTYARKKDKYSLFLDNLHPLVVITNETAQSEKELALIKDSYANAMVPFLVRHYKKIYVFDTRYYKEGPSDFIKEHPEITDVLILYNMNTLDTDTGIRGIY